MPCVVTAAWQTSSFLVGAPVSKRDTVRRIRWTLLKLKTGVATSCPSDEVLFKAAAQEAVKTLPELDDRNKLRLYAHYKQATVGPAQGSRPSIFQQVARAKWDAWSELQSMNNIDAMRGYCSLADEFVPGWRTSVQEGHSSQNQADTTADQTGVATSCPSDEVLFQAAQDAVKTLPELDDRNKLRLYAHYKQATVGPAQGSRPSIFQQVARAKWDAWSELQNMNNIDAMRGYCSLADEFVPGWRTSVQEGHSSQNQVDTTEDQTGVATSCPSDEVLFKAAQDAVKTLPELDDRNKLRLYAHYKQATVGPAQGSRPSIFQQVARAKWDAWSELQSMNNIDAMRGYCSLADEFVPGWRTSVQEGHSSQNQADTTADQTGVATSCPSDEVLFQAAQDAVKTLPELDDCLHSILSSFEQHFITGACQRLARHLDYSGFLRMSWIVAALLCCLWLRSFQWLQKKMFFHECFRDSPLSLDTFSWAANQSCVHFFDFFYWGTWVFKWSCCKTKLKSCIVLHPTCTTLVCDTQSPQNISYASKDLNIHGAKWSGFMILLCL